MRNKNDSHGHAELASTGTPKLTAKQERFAQLVASGSSYSDAYRQAYDAENTAGPTINSNAYKLAVEHNAVAMRIEELQGDVGQEMQIHAQDLVAELQEIANAPVQGPVRAADKIAAVREIGRLAGLYRDDRRDRDNRPIQLTKVTVILDHGDGTKTEETHEIGPPVVEGESHLLPGDETESLG